jgi:hypothetical protein
MGSHKLLFRCFGFALLLSLTGCGAIGGGGVGSNLTISVQAQNTTLQAGQSDLLGANVMHSGGNPAVTWSLSGSTCPNACGALSSTINGETYTPPDFVPVTFQVNLTATAVANPSKSASVAVTVNHSLSIACPFGNEAALAGQYAFLLGGGGAGAPGGVILAGSFTADGKGNITAGLEDINSKSAGPQTGVTISGESLYTVGSDHRGCLAIVNSQNALNIYRFALSSFSAGIASFGRIIEFDDTTGSGTRAEGFLEQQHATSFMTSAVQGNYVFGLAGGDSSKGRYASAGVCTANAGSLSNGNMDSDDAGVVATNITGISGSYSVASSGRGTMTWTTGGGQNFVLYMISASRFIAMASDALDASHPLQSGQFELQSGTFNNATLNAPAVVHLTSFDSSSSAGGAAVGLVTPDGAGNATQVLDSNIGGTYTPLQSSVLTYAVNPNGRVVLLSGLAKPPVLYLSGVNSGYVVGTDAAATFGNFEPQTGGPFSNASLSGTYAYGTEGTAVGGRLTAVGSAVFDGMQNNQAMEDESSPAGLVPNISVSNAQYLFSSASSPPGRGTLDVSNNVNPSVAYIISPTKLIYINPPAIKPSLVVVEK